MSHILIVESDRLLAKNLAGALIRAGHDVVYTVDAQAAITAADAHKPDALIIDLLLAGRSGIELLYELRSYPDWKDIPVIIYSSIKPSELSAECFEQFGITKAFYKPLAGLRDITDEIDRLASLTPLH